jgi:hypothetical protein
MSSTCRRPHSIMKCRSRIAAGDRTPRRGLAGSRVAGIRSASPDPSGRSRTDDAPTSGVDRALSASWDADKRRRGLRAESEITGHASIRLFSFERSTRELTTSRVVSQSPSVNGPGGGSRRSSLAIRSARGPARSASASPKTTRPIKSFSSWHRKSSATKWRSSPRTRPAFVEARKRAIATRSSGDPSSRIITSEVARLPRGSDRTAAKR